MRSHTEGPKTYSIPVSPSDLGLHFGQLLESGKDTDVNFDVNGEIFTAHKLVLAARSPVFRAQLFGPMKDQNTEHIKVEDMEAPVFKVKALYYSPPLFCPYLDLTACSVSIANAICKYARYHLPSLMYLQSCTTAKLLIRLFFIASSITLRSGNFFQCYLLPAPFICYFLSLLS